MNDLPMLNQSRANRSDAARNRELLLQTARRLFDEQGVDAVPMSAVAEAAGVGKGTLYRHFPNKAVLCETLIHEAQRDLQERTFVKLRQQPDPAVMLHWFLREVSVFVYANAAFLRTGGMEIMIHPAHGWWRQTIRALLGRIDFSHKPTPPDLDVLTDVLYLMLDVRVQAFQESVRGWDLARIQDGFDSLLDALIH